LGYADYPLEVAARQIAARGFKQVEITSLNFYCLHYRPEIERPADILRTLRAYGLTPTSMNYSVGKLRTPDRAARQFHVAEPADAAAYAAQVRALIDDASAMGLLTLLVPIGMRAAGPAAGARRRIFAELLCDLAEYAAERGLRLSAELPHLYMLAYDLETTGLFFSYVKSDKLIDTVDSSHWGVGRYDLRELFRRLSSRIGHIHLRDAAGPDTADFKQRLEMTPGRGGVDFAEFGRVLDEAGYRGQVVLEMEYRGGYSLEQIEAEYDFGIAYLKRCGWQFPAGI